MWLFLAKSWKPQRTYIQHLPGWSVPMLHYSPSRFFPYVQAKYPKPQLPTPSIWTQRSHMRVQFKWTILANFTNTFPVSSWLFWTKEPKPGHGIPSMAFPSTFQGTVSSLSLLAMLLLILPIILLCLICQSMLLAHNQPGIHCNSSTPSSEMQLLSQLFFPFIQPHRAILPQALSFAIFLVKIPKTCTGMIPNLVKICLNWNPVIHCGNDSS